MLLFLGMYGGVGAQQPLCPYPNASADLHGNHILMQRVKMGATEVSDPVMRVDPFTAAELGNGQPIGLFSNYLWMAGIRSSDNHLLVMADEYLNDDRVIYAPGSVVDVDETSCKNWDRHWRVSRHDLESHLADWADNGVLNDPVAAILGWPAKGNVYFEATNGFALPYTNHSLAPFYDSNGDGLYDPYTGDFPHPENLSASVLPAEMIWCLFHPQINADGDTLVMAMDVQQTMWALACEDNDDINYTIFGNYRFINFDAQIDSCLIGLYNDMNVGSQTDDFIGSMPDLEAVYVYNGDSIDTGVPGGQPLGDNIPALGLTVLNQHLYKSIYLKSNLGSSKDYFLYMNGVWPNGNPITAGGTGDNPPALGFPKTDYVFTGDPTDPDSWAMTNLPPIPLVYRVLPVVQLGTMLPQAERSIDFAYTIITDSSFNHLEKTTELRSRIGRVRQDYLQGFEGSCSYEICEDDCMWPGDANLDGIVNHHDVLPLGVGWSQKGPVRKQLFVTWAPQSADNWNTVYNQTYNFKHLDADGNGQIDVFDQKVVVGFYNRHNLHYQPEPDVFPEGGNLFFSTIASTPIKIKAGDDLLLFINFSSDQKIYGLSFTVDYGSQYWNNTVALVSGGSELLKLVNKETGQLDFALSNTDQVSTIDSGRICTIFLNGAKSDSGFLPDSTQFRIKNIRGVLADGTPVYLGAQTQTVFFDQTISVQAQPQSPSVQLFPNPSEGLVHILTNLPAPHDISIFDLSGRLMLLETNASTDTMLHLTDWPPGVYIVKIKTNVGISLHKLIIH